MKIRPSRLAAPLLATLLLVPCAWAQPGRAWALVMAAAPALVSPNSYNSTGRVNTVTAVSTGTYRVVFPGLQTQAGGNVQVSAFNGAHHCNVFSWGGTSDLVVRVNCHSPSGELVNGAFTVFYAAEAAIVSTRNSAYLWSHEAASANYTPIRNYQWSSRGNTNTVRRTGPGLYTAVLTGLAPIQAHAQVTAYGDFTGSCNVQGFSVVSGNLEVGVRCFNAAGSPADAQFSLNVTSDLVLAGDPAAPMASAYALAEQPTIASYTPSTDNNLRTAGTVTAARSGTGNYTMAFDNLYPSFPSALQVLVTAFGPNSGTRCNVRNWGASATGIVAFIHCRNSAGSLVDSQYMVLVLTTAPTVMSPPITISGVTTASEFGGFTNFSSGSYIEIKGSGLADTTRTWRAFDFTNNGQNAPLTLDGVLVTVNGIVAFPYYVSPTQLNVHTPADPATGPVQIRVAVESRGAVFTAPKVAVTPGMLTPAAFRVDGRQYLVATFPDRFYVGRVGLVPGSAFRPARPGDLITLYGIGFGEVVPSVPPGTVAQELNQLARPVTVSFGQIPATISYQGLAPGLVGLYQFNVAVPANLPSGDYQINMTLGGQPLSQPPFFLTVEGN